MRFSVVIVALGLSGGCAFNIGGLPIGVVGDGDILDLAVGEQPDLAMGGEVDLAGADLLAAPDLAPPLDLASAADLAGVDLATSGLLMVTVATTPAGDINLTTEGTADWGHWGLTAVTDWDHKVGGNSQISNYGNVKGGGVSRLAAYPVTSSWSDGTPTASATTTNTGIYINGGGQGFRLTAPADTTTRTLRIYCGGQMSVAQVNAHLSDTSAPDFTTTTTYSTAAGDNAINMQFQRTVTVVYRAASAGQTLTVDWTVKSGQYVHLESATLQ